ncbi:hypothetical protein C173_13570 [Paenibacillus sp. FSL R7-277]|uniref:hypothetical protein n=1 Tax=unclassified Paenibacillus TaxID=185978 RepID=UPI0003E25598|nr:hypothetical protein [Paenibacillus sp. FSL R7-277]ETT72374.1 hypothetical protein C173_13570 [Paenibacillus sp. FSL R7-277]
MPEGISFECKLFLDPKQVLLGGDGQLLPKVAGLSFELKDKMQIHLMDTPKLELYETGWIVRSRFKEEKWELTYKRRIRDYQSLDRAMKQAVAEGFTPGEYEAEVEWGYTKQALSLAKDFDIALEDQPEGQWKQLILDKAPQPFKNSSVFKSIADTRVTGPIRSEKYNSKWEQEKVHLEVWTIGAERIAEATMKIKNATDTEAADKHQQFITLFKEANLLLEQDISKTKWALEKLMKAHTPQTTH